jgi:hypothetical protein
MARIPMIRKTGHDKCLPLEPASAVKKCAKNVIPIIWPMVFGSIAGFAKHTKIAANPNHATDVKCHAKRSVWAVNSVLPNSLGKLSLLNRRINIYRSPR